MPCYALSLRYPKDNQETAIKQNKVPSHGSERKPSITDYYLLLLTEVS